MTTKEKILQSALKLFATQGIDKTSTAQITRDVGIASGTLFVHFKTKQELIDTLYLNIKKEAMNGLEAFIDPKVSVEKNIKNVLRNLIEHYIKHYNEFIFMELVENDPQVSKKALKKAQKLYANITKITAEWIKQGHLKDLGLEFIHSVMWNISMVVIRHCKINKIKKVPETDLDVAWEAVEK